MLRGPGAGLSIAREIATAPPEATREIRRRVLLAGETAWLALLADEQEALRVALGL